VAVRQQVELVVLEEELMESELQLQQQLQRILEEVVVAHPVVRIPVTQELVLPAVLVS